MHGRNSQLMTNYTNMIRYPIISIHIQQTDTRTYMLVYDFYYFTIIYIRQ
jgi:hypothetical protein